MFRLSQEGEDYVKNELTRYEDKRSAILPALYRVQKENMAGSVLSASHTYPNSWICQSAEIEEVFTFYTMYNKKPVGQIPCSSLHQCFLCHERCS